MFWGALAGFMSLLVNVGAPPFQIHILPQRLDKLTLVGTTVMFLCLHEFDEDRPVFRARPVLAAQFRDLAALWPLAVATNFLGIWLVRRTPTDLFYRITLYVDVFDLGRADLAGLARAEAGRLTN